MSIIANEEIDSTKLENARKIIINLQNETKINVDRGKGPFTAAIYDDNGNLIAKSSNCVVELKCSNEHAEMLAIMIAEEKFNNYDLSKYNLSLYVTSEPCIMCIGGIMWSGIKAVYYGVPSKRVEEITGFDEGFKPGWLEEFKKRGITVYGNIEHELGEKVLEDYVKAGKTIYKPCR